jgi:hypothetical protein
MDQEWLRQRPHLAPLARTLNTVLMIADGQYQQGRASGDAVDYGEFEERVAHVTAKVEQDVHSIALSGLDVDVPFIRVWGRHYRRVHRIARTYGSLSGPVTVERTLYRELGQRQGPVLDPIAVRAGVVDGSWLPRTARAIAHLVSQVTSREAEATGRELMRLPYSRSSIERVGHAVGAEYLSRREHVEPKLIETCELPPGIASVSVSVDRVTVPMEEPAAKEPEASGRPVRLQEDTLRKFGHEVSPRTQAVLDEAERAAKGARPKIQRNYRMAYCATVTMHDSNGDALHTIRYGRMPAAVDSLEQLTHRDVHRMMQHLQQDVITIRRRAGPVPVVLLADGAPELWRLFELHLNENKIGCAPVKLVDAWDALEYIAAAARLLESRVKAWPGTFRRWKTWLLKEPGGAERVLYALQSSDLQNARDEAGKRPVGDAVRYIQARLALMNYAEARRRGLPIGSGAVEATCKSLVSVRMKRCGSRWKHQSGNEILQLRALQLSDRWDAAMPRILGPLRKPVHVVTSRYEALRAAA